MDGLHGLALAAGVLVALTLAFYGLHRRLLRQKQAHIRSNVRQLALLRTLIAGLQRHRGLSNGVLCGDAGMSQELAATRQTLDQQIRAAGEFGGHHRDAWNSLIDHWSRLREGAVAMRPTTWRSIT